MKSTGQFTVKSRLQLTAGCSAALCSSACVAARRSKILAAIFRVLEKHYGFSHLTSTTMRKITSTEATLNLPGQEAVLVTRQLSHSSQKMAQYYQTLHGAHHAALTVHSCGAHV